MAAEPGWYPDPSGRPGQIYWDGQQWVPPASPPQKPVPAALRRRWTSLRTRTKIAALAAVVAIPVFTVWVAIGVADSFFGSSGGAPGSSSGKRLTRRASRMALMIPPRAIPLVFLAAKKVLGNVVTPPIKSMTSTLLISTGVPPWTSNNISTVAWRDTRSVTSP